VREKRHGHTGIAERCRVGQNWKKKNSLALSLLLKLEKIRRYFYNNSEAYIVLKVSVSTINLKLSWIPE
jgi:hypothetical protein